MHIPEEYGGSGVGMVAMAIVVEEVAKACASTSVILTTQGLAMDPLLLAGSHEQKEKWLRPMAEGTVLGACAITEPGAGSDVSGIRTVAVPRNGGYVLNGSKIFITHGGVADFVTVVVYTDKEKGHKGISLFLVPKDTPGFTVGKKEKKMGIRGSDTRELVFEDCFVPEENLVGKRGEGFYTLMKTFNYTRPLVAAQAVGIAQGALDEVLKYVKERSQFGKPLVEFQGLQWMLAEMAFKVDTPTPVAGELSADPRISKCRRLLLDHILSTALKRYTARVFAARATGAGLGDSQFKATALAYQKIPFFHFRTICHDMSSFPSRSLFFPGRSRTPFRIHAKPDS